MADRTYPYRRQAMGLAWPTHISTRQLPDGRYELRLDGLAPVVLSAALFAARSDYQRWQILRVLGVYGNWFARQHGLELPIETGRFVECGAEFLFEAEDNPYTFARLRIPRRIVVPGEAS
jgi:hypothetical protein